MAESETMFEYVMRKLTASKGSWPAVAEATGVPYRTLKKVADGTTQNPTYETVEALYNYFRKQPANSSNGSRAVASAS